MTGALRLCAVGHRSAWTRQCARAMSCRAGVGKAQGERSLGSLASRRGCRWLTARWGQVPGGGHRVHAAAASFSLGRARPGQASGSCRPTASGGALGSRELVSGPGQQGAGRQPRGASLAPRAQGRAEPRQGPRGSGRPPPAQAAGGTGSASVSGFQLLLEARGLPRPSGPPPSPLHYPFPAFGFRSAWHARAICRKHSGITYGQTALARSLPVPPGRGAHTPAALGAAGDLPPRPRPPALLWAAWPLLSRPPSLQSPV